MYIIMDMRCDGHVNVCMSTQDGEEDDDLKNEDLDPQNPREYLQKAAANMDDEYSNKKGSGSMQNYYGIAHTLREPVNEQPSLIVNGRLKQYQVRHFPLLSSLHIYTRTYVHILVDKCRAFFGEREQVIKIIGFSIVPFRRASPQQFNSLSALRQRSISLLVGDIRDKLSRNTCISNIISHK